MQDVISLYTKNVLMPRDDEYLAKLQIKCEQGNSPDRNMLAG